MTMTRIINRVDQLGSAWEEFKKTNEQRLAEIEKNGKADPLTEEKLARLDSALSEQKSRVDHLETAGNRPFSGEAISAKQAAYELNEHKAAFDNYLRRGVESDLAFLERKALSVGSDPDGGYMVTPQMAESIVKTVFESSPMRKVASVLTVSSDALEVIQDNDEAAAGWTAETASVSETDSPQIAKKIIPVHELYAQPKATQKLIDDSSVNIEEWLTSKITEVFSRKENTAFISGNGVAQPRGILTYAAGTSWGQIEQISSGSNGNVTADGIVKIFYALKEEYAVNSSFLMNRAAVQQARLLKETSTDQYLWQPGLTAGTPDTLMGVPVYQAADMETPATNSLSVAVGDFKRAYQIVDRAGVRILRDPFTEKPFVKFYATKRVGGDVVNFEAIKLLKLAS